MKFAHNIKLSVFAHDNEDLAFLVENLVKLVPFDLEDEKVELKKTVASGFEDKKIIIFEINLAKQSHVSKFIANLVQNLSDDQKQLLLRQSGSRLDQELYFFIRLDKDRLLNENRFWVTDSGNCFHIRIAIAAYPANRDNSLKVIKEMLNSG